MHYFHIIIAECIYALLWASSLEKLIYYLLVIGNYQIVSNPETSKADTMKLKLSLKRNGEIVFEIPLSTEDWTKNRLANELTSFERELDRFSKLFDALSHETRLRMMKHLLEDPDLSLGFGDFMRDLGLNPKTVWESTKKLQEGGLLVKSQDGRYRFSEPGVAEFLMLSLALRRLFKAMEEI